MEPVFLTGDSFSGAALVTGGGTYRYSGHTWNPRHYLPRLQAITTTAALQGVSVSRFVYVR